MWSFYLVIASTSNVHATTATCNMMQSTFTATTPSTYSEISINMSTFSGTFETFHYHKEQTHMPIHSLTVSFQI